MVNYKLTYFNAKGRGEAIRYMLAYGGAMFEDNRVDKKDWPALKSVFEVFRRIVIMTRYKFTYFNAKGGGEAIRFILAYSGADFEDNRIEKDNWPVVKAEQPFGQLPVLDTGDAFILTQSVAIARFLGNTFGLMGRDSVHNAQLDALVDHMQDLHMKLYAAIRSCDESTNPNFARGAVTANATFVSNVDDFEMNVLPFYLIKFNAIAAQGAFYGTDITWADVYFAGFMDCTETRLKKPLLEPYPFLSALKSRVEAAPGVQDYLEGRPFTTM